jgi:hypothetical protein
MVENLLQWLALYRVKSGPIFNKDPRNEAESGDSGSTIFQIRTVDD